MRKFVMLVFFFLCFSHFCAFSENIIVTSNADSGPGTLREALNRAGVNGTGERDRILFNLPDQSEAGRTIVLLSQLPEVSSNLEIDGSTQPGNVFGVSTAKVQLLFDVPLGQSLSGLRLNEQHDVSIFGLYIRILTDTAPVEELTLWKGIQVEGGKDIQIGGAGKGNVISGFYMPVPVNLDLHGYTENISIQANFFGMEADGNTRSSNETNPVSLFGLLGTVRIGGMPAEGNIFTTGMEIYQVNCANSESSDPRDYAYVTAADIVIKGNKVGINYEMDQAFTGSIGFLLHSISPGGRTTYFIEDNVISADALTASVSIENSGRPATILRNYIGIDPSMTHWFSVPSTGIFLRSIRGVKIGNEDPDNTNYIVGCKSVDIFEGVVASVNKNSFFCTVDAYPMINPNNGDPQVIVDIRDTAPDRILGKATPNSVVELFYADQCGTCSPETYFGQTTADGNGDWQYSGPLSGTVIASATLNGQTSEFTRVNVNTSNLKVVNECDGGDGAIMGLVPLSGSNVTWVDEQGNTVGTAAELKGVGAGKYKMVLSNDECDFETPYYEVLPPVILDTTEVEIYLPSCGNANGAITGLIVNNLSDAVTLSWKDAGGKEWSTSPELDDVPAGSYWLTVRTGSTCSKTYGPVILSDDGGPTIDITGISVVTSLCGTTTGSISNVTVGGTGTLRYRWLDQDNIVKASGLISGTTAALRNVGPGTYRLELTDDSSCPAALSAPVVIRETSGLSIDESKVRVVDENCEYLNGSIKGIVVTGAAMVQWLDEKGNVAGSTEDLAGVKAGNYHLVIANAGGCTMESKVYEVKGPARIVYALTAKVTDVSCSTDIGTVELVNNGEEEPLAYRWIDANGDQAGTGPKLDAPAGTYALYITDINHCELLYAYFPIADTKHSIPAPLVSDVKVCAPGEVLIQVSNVEEGNYILYDALGAIAGESVSGSFKVAVNANASYTVVRRTGDCESPPATINVIIELGSFAVIANSFSPNGDGKNDYWEIPGMQNYAGGIVSVFNRQGVQVFRSVGYQQPFDGKYRGADLPVGVYYYVIDLKRACGLLTGSLTIVR